MWHDRVHRIVILATGLILIRTWHGGVGHGHVTVPARTRLDPSLGAKAVWKQGAGWFGGDLNKYYNALTSEEDLQRKPQDVNTLAVHRWLGRERSTTEHYKLILAAAGLGHRRQPPRVMDAGCGLGAGLLWIAGQHPDWSLEGYTVSQAQYNYSRDRLNDHRFKMLLRSYDDPAGQPYDLIFSIEALVHSQDLARTLRAWAAHLTPGGRVVVIDDFVARGRDDGNDTAAIELFRKAWIAPSCVSLNTMISLAAEAGLDHIETRDVGKEYDVVGLNYDHQVPEIPVVSETNVHQAWIGAQVRKRATVLGSIQYLMVAFRKQETKRARV